LRLSVITAEDFALGNFSRYGPRLAVTCRLAAAMLLTVCWPGGRSVAAEGSASRPSGQALVELTPAAMNAIEKGLKWLASAQNEDGSYGRGRYYPRNVAITALACMAFVADGNVPGRGRYARQVSRALDFILSNADESGLLAAGTGHGPMYSHGFATLLLAELYGMSPRSQMRERLEKAVHLIVITQNAEGGWRYQPVRADADISVTTCQLIALRAARNAGIAVPRSTVEAAVRYIRACQNADGGFSYQIGQGVSGFARSAAAVAALQFAGLYRSDEVRRGLDYLMRFVPPARPVTEYYFYGHYYAAQATFFAGKKYWLRWFPAVRDELLARQRSDGSWHSLIGDEYATAMALIILQIPKRLLPVLQR